MTDLSMSQMLLSMPPFSREALLSIVTPVTVFIYMSTKSLFLSNRFYCYSVFVFTIGLFQIKKAAGFFFLFLKLWIVCWGSLQLMSQPI
jgi:hypothetical protein